MIIKIIAIIAVIVLFYGNTLFNGFVHDDIWQIVDNKDLRSIGNLPKIFSTCIAEEILGTCKNIGFYYRPLQFVSYLFTYQISKDAWAFHLVNLLYTFVLAILVFKFFQIIYGLRIRHSGEPSPHPLSLEGRGRKKSPLSLWGRIKSSLSSWERARVRAALFATLFFLAHPVNSEVVNWIGGVPELLVSIFTIAMLLCYIKFSGTGKTSFLLFSAILYFLGLLSKEIGLFALGLIFAYEIIFVGIKTRREALQKYLKVFVFYLAPLILYLIMRAEVLGRIVYKYEGFYSMTFWQQIGNAISLFPQYVLKLFYPLPLSLQHPFKPISEAGAGVIFGVMLLGVFGFLLYLAIAKKQKILIFGLLFFLVTILPYLIFVNKLGEFVFSERYLFLPSIGFTLIVFEAARRGLVGLMAKKAGLLGFAVYLAVSWYIVAVNRNKDWKDNLASYQSIVRAYPLNKNANDQVYTILFKLSSKKFVKNGLFFLYPSGWKIDSCHLEVVSGFPSPQPSPTRGEGVGISSPSRGEDKGEGEGARDDSNCVILQTRDNSFNIEIRQDKKPAHISVEEYLEKQTSSLGTLINQGPALIPNADNAFVKIWQDSSTGSEQVSKMQFFLFKKDMVVEIRVWPSDSVFMRDFDEILRSLEIR